jgi:hypothetical protein
MSCAARCRPVAHIVTYDRVKLDAHVRSWSARGNLRDGPETRGANYVTEDSARERVRSDRASTATSTVWTA